MTTKAAANQLIQNETIYPSTIKLHFNGEEWDCLNSIALQQNCSVREVLMEALKIGMKELKKQCINTIPGIHLVVSLAGIITAI